MKEAAVVEAVPLVQPLFFGPVGDVDVGCKVAERHAVLVQHESTRQRTVGPWSRQVEERSQERGDIGIAVLALFRQRPQQCPLDVRWNGRIELRGRYWWLLLVLHAYDDRVLPRDRRTARQHLIANTGERVLIAPPAGDALELLGCHVER